MYSQTTKKAGMNNSNFLWKMQMVHINLSVHTKHILDVDQAPATGKHYVPWLSLVAIKI